MNNNDDNREKEVSDEQTPRPSERADLDPDFGEHLSPKTQVEPSRWQEVLERQPLPLKIGSVIVFLLALTWLLWPSGTPEIHSKPFLIAVDKNWYPLPLKSRQANMTAFCQSLISKIATLQGLRVNTMVTDLPLFELVARNECDGVVSPFAPKQGFQVNFVVSEPLYQLGVVLVVRKDALFKDITQLEDHQVGIVNSSMILMRLSDYPNIIFNSYDSVPQALQALDVGVIDGAILDNLKVSGLFKGLYSGKFKILFPPLINEGIELYIRKSDEAVAFIKLFDEGLDKMYKSGEYSKLLTEWDLINTSGQ